MSDVLVINGSTVDMVASNAQVDLLIPHTKGGIPELHFSRLLGPLTALPDPWSGQACALTMGGSLVFAGDTVGYCDRYLDGTGWVREYRAMGLLNRAGYIPVTDATSLTDTCVFNLPGDDPAFVGSKAGRTVGQIVATVLTMLGNATALNAAGLGAYTSMGPPAVLPTATLTDLAALTVVPPWRVSISGERILQSLESFVTSVHPNHFLHVEPGGTIRFLDSRSFSVATLTIGGDPRLDMPSLTRDYSDSYSQVAIRGNTRVEGFTLQTLPFPGSADADGGLQEDFAWGVLSNAAAKSGWVPACWTTPLQHGSAAETGTCTCTDTTHVVLAVTGTYTANYWDQTATGVLGWIVLYADSLGGLITQQAQARVIASTASSGGHITVTLDVALPSTAYGSYQLWGLAQGCAVVGRRYKVRNAAIAAALEQFFPYPVPWHNAAGTAAQMTTSPIAEIIYNGQSATNFLTLDPVNGLIYLARPAQTIFGSPQWPDNVRVFVPVATGTLAAYAPSISTFAGTLSTVEGIHRRKTITALDWRDYSNQASMDTFAAESLDSLKDVVVEGTVPYQGLLSAYLTPGKAVSIAGTSGASPYVTGWEALALPVVSAEIRFQPGPEGTSYQTILHLSNRRGRYAAENFLRPNITGMAIGTDGEVFGAGGPQMGVGPAFTPENTTTQAADTSGVQQLARDMSGPGGLMGQGVSARDAQQQMEGGVTAKGISAQDAQQQMEGGVTARGISAKEAQQIMEGGG
jgi:hypothetical protein